MSDTILALLGFATVIAVIVLLLRNVTVPALAFVSVSTITAAILVATGAFTLDEMAGFIKEGVKGVHGTAVLFIFSVLFFGVMTDAGMFDKIIGALMKKVGNNVVGVALMTCLIAIIGHLDGGGASTFLITIPAMLPVYKRLHMRRETLLLICVTAMGVMNLMPWGGPTIRAATALGMGEAHIVDAEGSRRRAACMGGMLTVLDGEVRLVATTWEWAEQIDHTRAEAAKKRAEEILARKDLDRREYEMAQARLKRALVRTSIKE